MGMRIQATLWVGASALLLSLVQPAWTQTLSQDQVEATLQAHSAKEHVHECVGRGDKEQVVRAKIAISPDGKTAFLSMAPDLGPETRLCVKYALESIRFPETDHAYEITYIAKIPPAAGSDPDPYASNLSDEYYSLKRQSDKMIASGLVLTSVGALATGTGALFGLINSIEAPHCIDTPEALDHPECTYTKHRIPLSVFLSGLVVLITGVTLLMAGFNRRETLKLYDPSAFKALPGLTMTADLQNPTVAILWTF